MYCDYFGLRLPPFEDRADLRFFFATPENEETLAAMEYEAHYGNGIALIVGEPGTGKTMLCRALVARVPATDHTVVLNWSPTGSHNLVRETCKGFGVSLPTTPNHTRRINRLRRHLARIAAGGHRALLIVDQAENLSADNLWELAALMDLFADRGRLLSIVLLAGPQIRRTLDRPEFTRMKQQLFGEKTLSPLTEPQTTEFIKFRLRAGGMPDPVVFDVDAIALIHRISRGLPRLINRLCNAALVSAYAAQQTIVSRILMEEVVSQQMPKTARVTAPKVVDRDQVPRIERTGRKTRLAWELPQQPIYGIAGTSPGSDETPIFPSGAAISDNTTPPRPEIPNAPSQPPSMELLERTLERAERVNATTEASTTKAAAIERHLASLLDRADRISQSLGSSLQANVQSVEQVRTEMNEIVADVKKQTAAVRSQFAHSVSISTEGNVVMERLQKACDVAHGLESSLNHFAGQLADKADDVQTSIAQLFETIRHADGSRNDLAAAVERSREASRSEEERIAQAVERQRRSVREDEQRVALTLERAASVSTSIQSNVSEFEQFIEESIRKANERVINAIDKGEQKTFATHAAFQEKFSRLERAVDETIAAGLERLAAENSNHAAQIDQYMAKASNAFRDQVNAIVQQAKAGLERSSADYDRARTLRASDLRLHEERIEQLETRLQEAIAAAEIAEKQIIQGSLHAHFDELQRLQTAADDSVSRLHSEYASAMSRLADVDAGLVVTASRTDEAQSRIAAANHAVNAIVERLQRDVRLDDIQKLVGQIVTAQHQASATLVDVGVACERVASAAAQAADVEKIATTFSANLRNAQARVIELDRSSAVANETIERLQQTLGDSSEIERHVQLTRAAADGAAERLTEVVVQAQRTLQDVSISAAQLQPASLLAKNECDRLTAAIQVAQPITVKLDELTTTANPLHENLVRLVPSLDVSAQKLKSYHNESVEVIGKLLEANTVATLSLQTLKEHESSSAQKLDAAREWIEKSLNSAQKTAADAAQGIRAFESQTHVAGDTLDRLLACVEPTRRIIIELNEHTERARKQLEEAGEQSAKYQLANEQLAAASRVLADAKETSAAIRKSIEDARNLQHALSKNVECAEHSRQDLAVLNESAHDVVQTQQQLLQTVQETSDRIEGQLSSLQAADQLIQEFTTQATDLNQGVQQLRRHVGEVEKQVEQLIARPREIAENAQAQAAELEKVCAAVRKVFAGLSQAGLDARQQTTDMRTFSEQASASIAAYTSKGEQTIQMLREALQMATRGAERLEKALMKSESRSSSAFAGAPVENANSALLRNRLTSANAIHSPAAARGGNTRADEITRLLEEARQGELLARS